MRQLVSWTGWVLLLTITGCDARPTLEPTIALLVTLDGQPVSGLNLRLVGPEGATVGGGASGPNGRAVLRGPQDNGIPPGTYKITVTDAGDDEPDPMAPAPKAVKSRVPPVYTKVANTPLTVTVEPGKTEYPVALKSKP